eukprot:IDg10115t1
MTGSARPGSHRFRGRPCGRAPPRRLFQGPPPLRRCERDARGARGRARSGERVAKIMREGSVVVRVEMSGEKFYEGEISGTVRGGGMCRDTKDGGYREMKGGKFRRPSAKCSAICAKHTRVYMAPQNATLRGDKRHAAPESSLKSRVIAV